MDNPELADSSVQVGCRELKMSTVLFVHGTGVRQGSFFETFSAIRRAFDRHSITHSLEPCLWGDVLGASSVLRSVPDVVLKPQGSGTLLRDQDYARWELLYRDPLFELRLLKNRTSVGPKPPSANAAGKALWARINSYVPSDPVLALIGAEKLGACWAEAWKAIVVDDLSACQVTESSSGVGEPAQAVARSVVAETLRLAFELQLPLLDGRKRDALVDQLVDDWEGRVAGLGTTLLRFFGEMVARVVTPVVKARRGIISEVSNPGAGDILRYQARGSIIRDYIRASVNGIDGDVFLLAHSLGGIACVDLLVEESISKVKGLVTVGSQAPYLHEIGALSSLEPGTTELPAHFPPWLNLYDPYDFLSFVAEPVFQRGVRDIRIESGQPFPHSHSAYWANVDTWGAIQPFLA